MQGSPASLLDGFTMARVDFSSLASACLNAPFRGHSGSRWLRFSKGLFSDLVLPDASMPRGSSVPSHATTDYDYCLALGRASWFDFYSLVLSSLYSFFQTSRRLLPDYSLDCICSYIGLYDKRKRPSSLALRKSIFVKTN